MSEAPEYDENLWFEHKGCKGKHYFIGNPHTFPGRMWAWCEYKQRTFFVSKSEIGNMSTEAAYWMLGFITGNQPKPPVGPNGQKDLNSPEYEDWKEKIRQYEITGSWKVE